LYIIYIQIDGIGKYYHVPADVKYQKNNILFSISFLKYMLSCDETNVKTC
jgi:hypothetical protein